MRITNRIINILVLLLAIAGVVLAYFLFNKRETLVGGWNEMASSIGKTAKELDANSGTKLASDLNEEKLSHKNFKDNNLEPLVKALPKLQDQSKKIVSQRDALASTVTELAKLNEVGNIKTADLQDLAKSQKNRNDAVIRARATIDRNNRIFKCYINTLSKLGVGTDTQGLKNNYINLERRASEKVDFFKNRINAYRTHITDIAEALEVSCPGDNGDYKRAVSGMIAKIKTTQRELVQTKNDLSREKRTTNDLRGQVKNRDNQIVGLKKTIQGKDRDIKTLKFKINPDDGTITIDNRMLYAGITGKIENVNKKWGFVLINLGKKIKVVRKFPVARKDRIEYLSLQVNDRMTVGRGMRGAKPVFIAKLHITKVGEDYAFANIMDEKGTLRPETDIQIGDTVYFSQDDIKRMNPKRLDVLSVDPAFLAGTK